MLAGSIALAYSIQHTHASHPCWDERRCLPRFHPLDGLPTLGCRPTWNAALECRPTFNLIRHSFAVTGVPGVGYLACGRSPTRSRVVFTGGLQRRLSVCGLLFLMLVSLVTRPAHRVGFIIPHFELCANHSSFRRCVSVIGCLVDCSPCVIEGLAHDRRPNGQ